MRRLLAGMLLPVVIAGCSGAGSESRAQPVKGDPAFPGAVGYGAAAKGGRGGRILGVDTLADGGPGSLRACIDATGPDRKNVVQGKGVAVRVDIGGRRFL